MKPLAIVVVVVVAAVLGVRSVASGLHWYGCTEDAPLAALLTVEHLGAPPSVDDCAAYKRDAERRAAERWAEEMANQPMEGIDPESLPGPTSTGPDYGKKSCAEGGCTVWGPCPNGTDHPPVSHWVCTNP